MATIEPTQNPTLEQLSDEALMEIVVSNSRRTTTKETFYAYRDARDELEKRLAVFRKALKIIHQDHARLHIGPGDSEFLGKAFKMVFAE